MFDELRDSTLALQHFYDVEEPHARDPFGTLHRATEQPFGRPVSVWVLDRFADMDVDESIVERMDSACAAATRYRSASSTRVLDIGRVTDDLVFVVTEPITGRTLREVIATSGPLSAARTLRVVEQVAEAIHEAHEHGIYRLGVDADRIEVVDKPRSQVRAWGLGIAMSRQELIAADTLIDPRLARAIAPGEFIVDAPTIEATPRLQETEHVLAEPHDTHLDVDPSDSVDEHEGDGGELDEPTVVVADTDAEPALRTEAGADEESAPRTSDDPLAGPLDPAAAGAPDLYALAALAYECLAGVHPYFRDDRDVGDGVLAILRESPSDLHDHYDVDPALAEVIHDALGADTRAVHDTIASFVAACRGAVDDEVRAEADRLARPAFLAGPVEIEAQGRTARTERRGPRPLAYKAALVSCAVLALVSLGLGWILVQEDVTRHADVPHFVPAAAPGEGVDVVISATTALDPSDPFAEQHNTEATVYLVTTRGENVQVGHTPFLLRNQQPDARVRLVLAGDEIQPRQVDVLVRDQGDRTQHVSERVYPITAPSRQLANR